MSERVLDAHAGGRGGGVERRERDWPEDFSHENGNYLNRCVHCRNQFSGHKRRFCCKVCASNPEPNVREAVARIENELRIHADDKSVFTFASDIRTILTALRSQQPEPEDAKIEGAIVYMERAFDGIGDLSAWQTIKAALLRSQAGQGRVVTADMMKEAAEAIGSRGRMLDSRDRLEMMNVLNALLA